MPLYQYQCPTHGTVDVIKPMARAGRPEYCRQCLRGRPGKWGPESSDWSPERVMTERYGLAPMRRIYNPQRIIMRPSGYNLRPGDHGYSNFDREEELGEIRSPGDKPESGGAKVERPKVRVDHSSASVAAERNLRQAVEAAIVEV